MRPVAPPAALTASRTPGGLERDVGRSAGLAGGLAARGERSEPPWRGREIFGLSDPLATIERYPG